jgi:hypothetical protein
MLDDFFWWEREVRDAEGLRQMKEVYQICPSEDLRRIIEYTERSQGESNA